MTQYAYPDADTSVGNWAASTGSNRYAMVDDEHDVAVGTADNTYIRVTDDGTGDDQMNPVSESITLSLSSVTDPSASNLHKVKVLWYEDSGMANVTLNVSLRDTDGGAVKNESFSYDSGGGMSSDPQEDTMTLSASQANSIGAYSNLSLILTATDSQMQGVNTTVYRAYFECPDGAAASGAAATPAAFLLFVD
jgi:hypothetical protein